MADKDEHMRAMVGDMVLTIAALKAEGDALKLENAALRNALEEAAAKRRLQLVEPAAVGGFETDSSRPLVGGAGEPGIRE